jgi:hypothetical protein
MKANVIAGDLNPCGGSERLTLVTMHTLSEMGIDFDLTTLKSPDLSKLENAFGKNLVSTIKRIKHINTVNMMRLLQEEEEEEEQQSKEVSYDYDITINTHGNWVPYYHSLFTRYNAITYCHFPSAKYHIESENTSYLEKDLGIELLSDINNDDNAVSDTTKANESAPYPLKSKKEWFNILKYAYWNLIKNSTIVTNSEFSRRAIVEAFGIDQVFLLNKLKMQ